MIVLQLQFNHYLDDGQEFEGPNCQKYQVYTPDQDALHTHI